MIEFKKYLELSNEYFDTLNSSFDYTLNNEPIYNKLQKIKLQLYGLIFFCIIPAYPTILKFLFVDKIKIQAKFLDKIGIDINKLYVWWVGCLVLSIVIFLIFNTKINKKIKGMEKKLLDDELKAFSYLFSAQKELKFYKINSLEKYKNQSNKYFKKYWDWRDGNRLFISEYDIIPHKRKIEHSITVGGKAEEIIEYLEFSVPWIKFDEVSKQIANGFIQLDHNFLDLFETPKNLDKYINVIEYLVIYEYLKIQRRKIEKEQEIKRNEENQIEILRLFSQKITEIELPEEKIQVKKPNVFHIFKMSLRSLLSHKRFIVLFMSWYLLLQFIFFMVVYFSIIITGLHLDTKILIGLLTAPFAGAIMIAINLKKN